jgi:hypothetical protein
MSLECGDIKNCDWVFQFQCPQRWERLAVTDDPQVRTCDVCLKEVYLCATDEEVVRHATLGHCVAIAPKESEEDYNDDDWTIGVVVTDD